MQRISTAISGFKRHVGPLWWYTMIMFIVARVADLIQFYIGTFLVPDYVDVDQLGAITPLTRIPLFMAIFMAPAVKFLNRFLVAEAYGKAKKLFYDLLVCWLVLSALFWGTSYLFKDMLFDHLGLEEPLSFWLLVFVVVLSMANNLFRTVAQGVKHFYALILARLLPILTRLVVMLLVLHAWQLKGYLFAWFMGTIACLVSYLVSLRKALPHEAPVSYTEALPEMKYYFLYFGSFLFFYQFQLLLEPWIVRAILPAEASAGYYMAYTFGIIPIWITQPLLTFLFPVVSDRHERGVSNQKILLQSYIFVIFFGLLISIILFFIATPLLNLRPSWALHVAYAPFLWQIGMISTLSMLFNVHAQFDGASNRFTFNRYFLPLVFLEMLLFFVWHRWIGFPPSPVEALQHVVTLMFATRILILLCMFTDRWASFQRQKKRSAYGKN